MAEPSRGAVPAIPGTATSVPRPEEERTLNHVTRYLQVVHAPGRVLPPAGALQARRKEKEARRRRHGSEKCDREVNKRRARERGGGSEERGTQFRRHSLAAPSGASPLALKEGEAERKPCLRIPKREKAERPACVLFAACAPRRAVL